LVETVGFEPTDLLSQIDGLANRCLRPLSHVSKLVAGVGFEPHDLWHMKPTRTTSPLTRNKTGAGGQFSLPLTLGTSVYLGRFPCINLAVLGGNDPHSSGVTGQRASVNTLEP